MCLSQSPPFIYMHSVCKWIYSQCGIFLALLRNLNLWLWLTQWFLFFINLIFLWNATIYKARLWTHIVFNFISLFGLYLFFQELNIAAKGTKWKKKKKKKEPNGIPVIQVRRWQGLKYHHCCRVKVLIFGCSTLKAYIWTI